MKKNIILIMVIVSILCGCSSIAYKNDKEVSSSLEVANDAFFLKGQKLKTVERNSLESADIVFFVEREEELAKAVQYAIENNIEDIAYQSISDIDIKQVAKLASMLNPFDLSITQTMTEYSSVNKEVIYISKHLLIKNLDELYSAELSIVNDIVKKIVKPSMSKDEKVRVIHDFIIKNTIYDVEAATNPTNVQNSSDVFQARGVFYNKKAVCAGYTRAFMMMARAAGVESLYIGSEELNHSWNYVLGDEGWKFIDVTWDDPVPDQENEINDRYIKMSKEEFINDGMHMLNENQVKYYDTIANEFF